MLVTEDKEEHEAGARFRDRSTLMVKPCEKATRQIERHNLSIRGSSVSQTPNTVTSLGSPLFTTRALAERRRC